MTEKPTPRRATFDEWRVAYALIVFATAGVLLSSMWTIVSPLLIYGLFILLLWPYAGTPRHLTITIAATLMLLIWLLDTLGGLVAPFIIALGIAYILDPVVDRLEARRVPRMAGVAIIGLPILTLLVLALIFGIPALFHQIEDLVQGLPTAFQRVIAWFERARSSFGRLNLPFIDAERFASQLSPERITAYIQERQAAILNSIWGAIPGVGRGFGLVLTVIGYVVLTPVLTIYLLRDFNVLTVRAGALMPPAKREDWLHFLREYDALLARFLRGQVLVAAIVGLLTWIGLLIVGFPYSGLVGVIAGVFNLVPYLGLVASIVPVLLIALLSGSFLTAILKAGIVFAIVQFIDGSIVGPRIVGGSVGLHPVWVILALALGGFFFGFVGLLLAMPAAVLIKLLLRNALERYRASRVFRATPADTGV